MKRVLVLTIVVFTSASLFLGGCGNQQPSVVDQHRVTTSGEEIDFNLQMMLLLAALEMYKIHVGDYPSTEQGLRALIEQPGGIEDESKWEGPYIESSAVLMDPWEQSLFYSLDPEGIVTLKSLGEDGIESEDDLDAHAMFPHWATEMEKMATLPMPSIEKP